MHNFAALFLSRPVRLVSLLSVFVFLSASLAFSQRRPLPTEPMEEYDQPPAIFYETGVSPPMDAAFGGFVSHQVNVNGQGMNITGDAANEPSIIVDPTDHNRMAIGWRQFNSVTSDFRQGGYGFTTDGGNTWTFPGVLENNVFRSDPVLFAQDDGKFFYNSLLQSFFDNIYRSLDGGQTWTNLQPAGQNATGGDKQWHLIDNIPTSTGYHFQYQLWSTSGNNFGGRQFSRSTDQGVTWQSPVFIPNSPVWGTLDVDTNGNVFIGGAANFSSPFWCVRSTNAKNGTVTPTFDQSTQLNLGGDLDFSDVINPQGLAGQVFLYVDRSGTATNNNIYIGACVQPFGFTTGTDFMFARSTNGGVSFSAPVKINDDPVNHNKWHWMGTFGVAPNGRIDAVWLDTRNAANNQDSQLFYSYSTDAGATWATNVAVSPSFNPHVGYPQQNKMGDYLTIQSDATGGDVAYSATFNNEEDVYYVRVAPQGGPGATPTPTPPATPTPTPTPTRTPTPTPTPPRTPTPTPTPTIFPSPSLPPPSPTPTPTQSPVPTPGIAFDFDGDRFADMATYRPSLGAWLVQRTRDGFTATAFGTSTDRITPADLDGDRHTDIAVYRPSTGTWYWISSLDGGFHAVQFGVSEDLPDPADFDGDGRADIAVYRPSEGVWYRLNSSNSQFVATRFGLSEDKPVAGDYDGDGRADIAVFRPSTSVWYRLDSSNGGFRAISFGASGDLTTAADFDGDGRTDLAVYRPGEGNWYVNRSTLGFMGLHWGVSTDIPAAADYDADGKADITVFRPSNATWYRINSSNGQSFGTPFGASEDKPIPSAFRY